MERTKLKKISPILDFSLVGLEEGKKQQATVNTDVRESLTSHQDETYSCGETEMEWVQGKAGSLGKRRPKLRMCSLLVESTFSNPGPGGSKTQDK